MLVVASNSYGEKKKDYITMEDLNEVMVQYLTPISDKLYAIDKTSELNDDFMTLMLSYISSDTFRSDREQIKNKEGFRKLVNKFSPKNRLYRLVEEEAYEFEKVKHVCKNYSETKDDLGKWRIAGFDYYLYAPITFLQEIKDQGIEFVWVENPMTETIQAVWFKCVPEPKYVIDTFNIKVPTAVTICERDLSEGEIDPLLMVE